MVSKLALLAAALPLIAAWEDGVDCTGDEVATDGQAGLFFAVDSDGYTMACDDVDDVSSDQ